MKLGLGFYRHMLTPENFRFAKQAGATHIVAHLVDYFKESARIPGTDGTTNWGLSGDRNRLWTYEELVDLKKAINAEGLELAAIENIDPSHWYDVLLDGPRKQEPRVSRPKQRLRGVSKERVGSLLCGERLSMTTRSPARFWCRAA